MIRGGFLGEEDRKKLIALARDGSATSRVTRRANTLVLLDTGWSPCEVAAALLLDDDTIRGWRKLFEQRGIEGLTSFDMGGSTGFLSAAQEDDLSSWVAKTLPRTTRQVGAWIEAEFALVYESRSGLIALLHRLGLEYHKPNVIPRKLNEAFSIGVEAIDQRPASVNEAAPIVERGVGFVALRDRSGAFDPAHGLAQIFPRIRLGCSRARVAQIAARIQNGLDRIGVERKLPRKFAQPQPGSQMGGHLQPALALRNCRLTAFVQELGTGSAAEIDRVRIDTGEVHSNARH
jgi:transposase